MEYTELTEDDRYRLLKKRLLDYEAGHFNATQNLAMAEATASDPDAQHAQADIARFEVALGIVRAELEQMPVPEPTPTRQDVRRAQIEARRDARRPQ